MNDNQRYFQWTEVHLEHFYAYFLVALVIAGYLVYKSTSKYKFELFFISFYLLTGNLNKLLTLKIPGFSLFEIQPVRFVFLLLLFFILRKTLFSREKFDLSINRNIPWFLAALFAYVLLLIVSVLVNGPEIGIAEVLETIADALAFLVLIFGLSLMADRPSYDLIGKAIIIGAVASSLVSLVQLAIDPYFLRIGDNRIAFAGILRSNGIFDTEYFNSYYLIIAISWTLITLKNNLLKISLVGLFTLGVISSFQRMSWIILALVLVIYLIYIKKVAFERLAMAGLSFLAILLTISIFYYQDIINSSLVNERLTDTVGGRKGYYAMVFNNIGKKPMFGYGDLKNEVYYVNLLRITRNRDRATATSGDLHSGYFSSLFLYGIPAFVCFTLFVLLSVIYYARWCKENLYFVIPFLAGIIYMVGNLTNTFLFLKYIAVLYAIHIGIGMGIHKIREQTASEN
ncbi:MAG: O-antigen ligase family protein [Aurantibacter sp.]